MASPKKTKRPAPEPKPKPKPKPKKAGKAPPKKAPAANGEARALLARDAADALQAVRGTFTDILEIYRGRVEGRLAGLSEAFRNAGREGHPPAANLSKSVLAAVKALKVKPRKGRCKDLQRLETLADQLWDSFPPEH